MKCSYIKYALAVCFFVFILSSCEEDEPTGFKTDGPTPTVTSVSPDTILYQKVSTITGSNFHSDPTQNIIRLGFNETFGYVTARAHAGSGNTLEFYGPAVAGETDPYIATVLSVSRTDAVRYSNEIDVSVAPVTSIFRDDFENSRGITSDPDGNIYCCDPDDGIIYLLTQDGGKTEYGYLGDFWGPGNIAYHVADGCIYGTTSWDGVIYKIPAGGGDAELYLEDVGVPQSIDFDEDGNMWILGSWWEDGTSGFRRVTPDGEITHLDTYVEHGSDLKIFDGYMYWSDRGGWGEGNNNIMKAPITADGLGTPEEIWSNPDWENDLLYAAGGFDMDVDGNLYVVSGYYENANFVKFTPTANGYDNEV